MSTDTLSSRTSKRLWRSSAALACLSTLLLNACVHPVSLVFPSFDGVIHYESVPGASKKYDLLIYSDNDEKILAYNTFHPATALGQNGLTLNYPGRTLPAWLNIRWRQPQQVDARGVKPADAIIEHRINVAPRIPPAVLRYAKDGEHRKVLLTLRIFDDRVLLSWSVRETAYDPASHHAQHVFSLYGGDLDCHDPGGEVQQWPCTAGLLQDAPWYQPHWQFI